MREAPSIDDPASLEGFPVWHVTRGTTLYRVTRLGHGPWWFSSGTGRFDLDPPKGTCYLADDPLVALLESLGPAVLGRVLRPALLDARQVWAVELPGQCDAADTTVRAARRYGVTGELATVTPYDVPRRWARAFAAAGFGGLRYRARHDPAGGRCLALFGAAGERRRWRTGRPTPASGLVARLEVELGIAAVVAPDEVDVIDDPFHQ